MSESTVRKIVAAELRAKQAEYDACPRSKVARRVQLAHDVKSLEREVSDIDSKLANGRLI